MRRIRRRSRRRSRRRIRRRSRRRSRIKSSLYLLSSRPEKRSSSLGARQKMMESRRNVKVRFTFCFRVSQFCRIIHGSVIVEFIFQRMLMIIIMMRQTHHYRLCL